MQRRRKTHRDGGRDGERHAETEKDTQRRRKTHRDGAGPQSQPSASPPSTTFMVRKRRTSRFMAADRTVSPMRMKMREKAT